MSKSSSRGTYGHGTDRADSWPSCTNPSNESNVLAHSSREQHVIHPDSVLPLGVRLDELLTGSTFGVSNSSAHDDPRLDATVANILAISDTDLASLGEELAWFERYQPDADTLSINLVALRGARRRRLREFTS